MPPTESKSSSEIWLKCPKAQLFSNTKLLLSYVESHFINKRLQTCKSHSSSKNSMEREKKYFWFIKNDVLQIPGGEGYLGAGERAARQKQNHLIISFPATNKTGSC